MATTALPRGQQVTASQRRPEWIKSLQHDLGIHLFLGLGLLLSAIPIFFMVNISFKNPGQFLTDPLGITFPLHWDNWVIAFNVIKRSLMNTALIASAV
jgi:ABC-type glycerol-3-phosphate transport system permease component